MIIMIDLLIFIIKILEKVFYFIMCFSLLAVMAIHLFDNNWVPYSVFLQMHEVTLLLHGSFHDRSKCAINYGTRC